MTSLKTLGLKVHGYVGADALRDLPIENWDYLRVLKILRDHVENRLETKFEVDANLATSSSGTIHISVTGGDAPDLSAELQSFAERCVEEFRSERLQVG